MSIAREDWLKAMADVGAPLTDDRSAVTITEFGAMFGLRRAASGERLRRLLAAGLAQETRKTIRDVSGRPQNVKAYRLTEQKTRKPL